MVGDIVGSPGRKACVGIIPRLRDQLQIDFVIANAENVAGGSGITPPTLEETFLSGVDVVTSGDHIFRKKAVFPLLEKEPRLLRPINISATAPGSGARVYALSDTVKVGVVNGVGRVFMDSVGCPFQGINDAVDIIKQETDIIIVDMHAEATSEKIAMGRYLDGKVSAVCGTHTHVQTADERILPGGTAYISDIGMTGPFDSVIGREVSPVLQKFTTGVPAYFTVAKNDIRLNGVIVDIDSETGNAIAISRVQESLENNAS